MLNQKSVTVILTRPIDPAVIVPWAGADPAFLNKSRKDLMYIKVLADFDVLRADDIITETRVTQYEYALCRMWARLTSASENVPVEVTVYRVIDREIMKAQKDEMDAAQRDRERWEKADVFYGILSQAVPAAFMRPHNDTTLEILGDLDHLRKGDRVSVVKQAREGYTYELPLFEAWPILANFRYQEPRPQLKISRCKPEGA